MTGDEENGNGRLRVSVSSKGQRTGEETSLLSSMSGHPTLNSTVESPEKHILPMRQSQCDPASTQKNQKIEAGQTIIARGKESE